VSSRNIAELPQPPAKPRRKRRLILWIFLAVCIVFILWALASANPFAQGIRDLLGDQPDQVVLEKSFSVPAHSFRYYTFTLPVGSKKVFLAGQFTASAQSAQAQAPQSSGQTQAGGGGIELLVLTETAFAGWQKGSSGDSAYHSSRVSPGEVHVQVPEEAGVYYVVFSNRLSPSPANVSAKLRLRYGSWLPDWLRH
jgi:hypothetical protein